MYCVECCEVVIMNLLGDDRNLFQASDLEGRSSSPARLKEIVKDDKKSSFLPRPIRTLVPARGLNFYYYIARYFVTYPQKWKNICQQMATFLSDGRAI